MFEVGFDVIENGLESSHADVLALRRSLFVGDATGEPRQETESNRLYRVPVDGVPAPTMCLQQLYARTTEIGGHRVVAVVSDPYRVGIEPQG